jgi:hypothetical protein
VENKKATSKQKDTPMNNNTLERVYLLQGEKKGG